VEPSLTPVGPGPEADAQHLGDRPAEIAGH
jgi:hypothetical protein